MGTVQLITAENLTGASERLARLQRRECTEHEDLWRLLDQVKDPEIPALSIWDMGILQDVEVVDNCIRVIITPTYSGCPAMDLIKEDVESALAEQTDKEIDVITRLSPAWTTDWMMPEAKERMRGSGIAAPTDIRVAKGSDYSCQTCGVQDSVVICPRCESSNTRVVSEFGSTACKALLQCQDCSETFDYFKQI